MKNLILKILKCYSVRVNFSSALNYSKISNFQARSKLQWKNYHVLYKILSLDLVVSIDLIAVCHNVGIK